MTRELFQQAIDALEDMNNGWKYIRSSHGDLYGVGWDRAQGKADDAIAALRQALAAPQPEPVAWRYKKEGGGWFVSDNEPQYVEQWNDIEAIQPLYAAPPAAPAPAVPLTEIQILGGLMDAGAPDKYFDAFKAGARFAEKQHGIGGGGNG